MQTSEETRRYVQKEQQSGCDQLRRLEGKEVQRKTQEIVRYLLRWGVLTICSDTHSDAVRCLDLVRRALAAASRPCWGSPLLSRILRLVLTLLLSWLAELLLGTLWLLTRVLLLGILLRLGMLL